ncbi:DUF1385 domain-containing protein [Brevibacillus fulvus]|uniref:DUF1385 domain-containing protein n=1 Tax=Brevibacillus fulvus TaxID=1125967 RepID=A0A938XQV6_9BACL|nr:DUF1385 domain-containing protein [Brevibacillus fulvus]MBM7588473.1 hypothetical protein [Brevibacillus fulvus]
MIMGISFGRGVFFHNREILACAEIKRGVIHVWAEKMTIWTLLKMWHRILFAHPWYYNVFHLLLLLYVSYAVWQGHGPVDPTWVLVYMAGFHFVFPKRLKRFHGAEHKVFSYPGEKKLEALAEIQQASIVNEGCSTNMVTCFFLAFLLTIWFLPLDWSIGAGAVAMLAWIAGDKYLRRALPFIFPLSAFLQKHVTTKEPQRMHLETAIRSYQMFVSSCQRLA